VFMHKSPDATQEKHLRMFYSSGYYSMDEFLEEAFGKTPRLFEKEPDKAYIGRSITKDPEVQKDIVDAKQRLLAWAGEQLTENDPVYIEFGVRAGVSMTTVSSSVVGREATFFGLDTFTGLPDGWVPMWGNREGGKITKVRQPGEMAVQNVPTFEDKRVVLIKGLFQDTLPVILPHLGRRRLFINIDGDTYTAALYGLFMLHSYLKSGDLIYFDELVDEINEFAAFNDYIRSCYVRDRFKPIARAFDGFLFRFE
jgi:hypothetical protein